MPRVVEMFGGKVCWLMCVGGWGQIMSARLFICLWCLSFFFSSRRRHTRFDCDWSSDVCSSDLFDAVLRLEPRHLARVNRGNALAGLGRLEEAIAEYDRALGMFPNHPGALFNRGNRSEEGRVGEEGRSRGWPDH